MLTVLAQIADAGTDCVARGADFDPLAVNENLPGVHRVCTENGPRHFRTAGSREAGESQDFAAPDREADGADFLAAAQAADFERDRCRSLVARSSDLLAK